MDEKKSFKEYTVGECVYALQHEYGYPMPVRLKHRCESLLSQMLSKMKLEGFYSLTREDCLLVVLCFYHEFQSLSEELPKDSPHEDVESFINYLHETIEAYKALRNSEDNNYDPEHVRTVIDMYKQAKSLISKEGY